MKLKKGFALFDKEKLKEITSRGGRNSQISGRGHTWDSKAASEAGKKGGKARAQKYKTGEFAV